MVIEVLGEMKIALILIIYSLFASYKWFTAYVATRAMSRIIKENNVIPNDMESYIICREELLKTIKLN